MYHQEGLGWDHGNVGQSPLYELSPGDSSLPAGVSHGGRIHPDNATSVQHAY
jgi:hypothetical protein